MNRTQLSRLETTLWLLNQTVFELERLLDLPEADEPLFLWKNPLSAVRQARIRSRLAELRALIGRLAREYKIEQRKENMLKRVTAQLHAHWVAVEDAKTKMMAKYGDVPANLKDTLDPELDKLNAGVSQLLKELTQQNDS